MLFFPTNLFSFRESAAESTIIFGPFVEYIIVKISPLFSSNLSILEGMVFSQVKIRKPVLFPLFLEMWKTLKVL